MASEEEDEFEEIEKTFREDALENGNYVEVNLCVRIFPGLVRHAGLPDLAGVRITELLMDPINGLIPLDKAIEVLNAGKQQDALIFQKTIFCSLAKEGKNAIPFEQVKTYALYTKIPTRSMDMIEDWLDEVYGQKKPSKLTFAEVYELCTEKTINPKTNPYDGTLFGIKSKCCNII